MMMPLLWMASKVLLIATSGGCSTDSGPPPQEQARDSSRAQPEGRPFPPEVLRESFVQPQIRLSDKRCFTIEMRRDIEGTERTLYLMRGTP